jgi:metal-responsive CopG/Arc/MetJ family transcriptional regulator
MTTISVSLDEELIDWLDHLIEKGVIKNRSEAVKGGIYTYIQDKLGIHSAKELREYLKSKQKKPFQSGTQVFRSVREEE